MSSKANKQQQNTKVSTQLLKIQRRIEALCDHYKRDEEFQFGLNFAISGIEQAYFAAEAREARQPARKRSR